MAWDFEDETKEEFLERIRKKIRAGLEQGVREGWWESFDEKRLEPIPFLKVFEKEDFKETDTLAHVMHKAEIFESVNRARKNGWNKPIERGEWTVTKQKIRVKII